LEPGIDVHRDEQVSTLKLVDNRHCRDGGSFLLTLDDDHRKY